MPQDADPSLQAGCGASSRDPDVENISVSGLDALWAESRGDAEICVAVLDGPVDLSHRCFQGAHLTSVPTLVTGIADGGPATAHGTHVASILFGQHDSPVRGIAPGCRGLIVPVFTSESGGGIAPCSQIDLARAIVSAVQRGAHVINISGGQLSDSDEAHPLLENAVQHCADSGVLIVAAVGNDGCQCLHVPAAMSSVLAVGASDVQGLPLAVSNWGEAYNGILAPGENIPGAVPGGGITYRSGTSFATPIVSGAVALLLSLQVKRGRQPEPRAVREAILSSADSCDPRIYSNCPRFLVGQLNVGRAREIIDNTNQVNQVEAAADTQIDKQTTSNLKERATEMSEFNEIESAPADLPESSPLERPNAGGSVRHDDARASHNTASPPPVSPLSAPAAVVASSCSCSNPSGAAPSENGGSASLVYAIGSLGYDFGSEARFDLIRQLIGGETPNPYEGEQLLEFLDREPYPWNADALIWTLDIDDTPIYAVRPQGPFSEKIYGRLRSYLRKSREAKVKWVSIPGVINGQARLMNGQVVPVIAPDPRGMFDWDIDELVNVIKKPGSAAEAPERNVRRVRRTKKFLERVCYELRNMGLTPQERAINFATTKAYHLNMNNFLAECSRKNLQLDRIDVEQSPVCRPQSDCWDVKWTFFNPKRRFEEAKQVYRCTVDVSGMIPVTVGQVRAWAEYS